MSQHIDALLGEFIQESAQTLVEADAALRRLAQGAEQWPSIIEELFRLLHSLKGNAALFDCQALKRVAHASEDVLDWLRQQESLPPESIHCLQSAVDDCMRMVDDLGEGRWWSEDDSRVREHEQALAAVLHGQERSVVQEVALSLRHLAEDHAELSDQLLALAQRLQPQDSAVVKVGDTPLEHLLHYLEQSIGEDGVPQEQQAWVAERLQALHRDAKDVATTEKLSEIVSGYQTFIESIGFDECLRDYLYKHLSTLSREGRWSWSQDQVSGEDRSGDSGPAPEAEKTMRVAERHIETFLAYVGDLLVIGDRYHHVQQALQPGADIDSLARDLRHANASFQQLSDDLQRSIMAVRQVSAESLLAKAARLVRNLASQQGKQIAVQCQGHRVQLDKSLMELLDAPTMHMVRNAVDHGIESVSEREQHNKPVPAQIDIVIREHEQQVQLEIRDDGRGLDFAAISQAARDRGILAPGQTMDQQGLIDCIFSPGISTARTVSDVSGRGVGLDVVQKKIREAGGDIAVNSSAQGTSFLLTMPRTVSTQIITGFMVRCAGEVVIIPMEQVERSFPLNPNDQHMLPDGRPCLKRDRLTLPLLHLAGVLSTERLEYNDKNAVVVHCRAGGHAVAVLVEALLGVQKVVLRPIASITDVSAGNGLVRGGALLGDGSVALVINCEVLHQLWAQHDIGAIAMG